MIHDISQEGALIRRLAGALPIPQTSFDPAGSWEHVYADRATFRQAGIGEFRIARQAGEDGFSLTIAHSRRCTSGYHFYTLADLACRVDEIATPTTWRVETKVAKAENAPPYLQSGMRKTCRSEGGTLRIDVDGHGHAVPVSDSLTCKWCLLEAVQRLPGESTQALTFSLCDEYDMVFPGHVLRYRDTHRVPFRNGTAQVICYEHIGAGMVPATFWVGPHGRLLFYMSGIEVLVLTEENGTPLVP